MNYIPEIIFLAGGFGKRMGCEYENIQKCMLKYNDKPILHHSFDQVSKVFKKFIPIIALGYKGDSVRKYFGKTWNNSKIFYTSHTPGSEDSGALLSSKNILSGRPFYVIHGNILYDGAILENMWKIYTESNTSTTICVSNKLSESMHDLVSFKQDNSNMVSKIYIPDFNTKQQDPMFVTKKHMDYYNANIDMKYVKNKFLYKEMGINIYNYKIFDIINNSDISANPHMIWIYATQLKKGMPISASKHIKDWIHIQEKSDLRRQLRNL